MYCRVTRQTPSLDPQVYRHMQLKIGQKEEKEEKPLDLQTTGICKTMPAVYRHSAR